MNEYMFIFRGGESPELMESPEIMQKSMMKWKIWIDEIAAQGKYLAGQPLLPNGKVISGKDKKITDGAFAEGKEMVGGYFLVKATNLDEAVELSKGCPSFEHGGIVEVREIMQMDM